MRLIGLETAHSGAWRRTSYPRFWGYCLADIDPDCGPTIVQVETKVYSLMDDKVIWALSEFGTPSVRGAGRRKRVAVR